MPSGPIHKQNAVSAGRDGDGDLLECERHGLGVAGWEDETGRLAERRTDGAEADRRRRFADPFKAKGRVRHVPPSVAVTLFF